MAFIWHDKPAKSDVPQVYVWLLLGGCVLVAQAIAALAKEGGW